MRQVAQNYRSGSLSVLDVPRPHCQPGGVLVQTLYSLISTGTEMMKVGEAQLGLVGKARARPDQVRKVVDTARQVGPITACQRALNRLDSHTPLGYSLSGVVIEVGEEAEEFSIGQLVACAGSDHALHAEVNWVPRNLCVPVPDDVAPKHAAFTTIGAIAMHAVRRAEVQLGETACVIGLGLVGQLLVELLVTSGIRVVGLDVRTDRCDLAEAVGAVLAAVPDAEGLARVEQELAARSHGLGADHVFIAAGGSSNAPVELAARVARDRGRVVDVGKCGLDVPWNAYYDKELDLRFSRSYGPGRYDDCYELDGVDYPAAYVRWTERRNLACFVDLLARSQLDVEPLVSGTFPIDAAPDAYARLASGDLDGVAFLIEYPPPTAPLATPPVAHLAPAETPLRHEPRPTRALNQRPLRIGFVGAGNYASSMLLPHLAATPEVELVHVATGRPLTAMDAQRRFGFDHASVGADAVLDDEDVDAVFITTRHRSHAKLTCSALERGKAVFVEKPLALSQDELAAVVETVSTTGNDRLMVGFNRRFAPLLVDLKRRFRTHPASGTARYLINAGDLAPSSWYADPHEGSRFTGEGGHFIDVLSWWFESTVTDVFAAGPDAERLHVTLGFENGAIGTVTYVAGGSARFPKETFDATGNGRNARLENFRRAAVWSGWRRRTLRAFGKVDKGQQGQLHAFVGAVRRGEPMPIPWESLRATTAATLAVADSLASGSPERL
jgi:predicted dehydrogenase/threonine dehydrogenase-like Zn-dependent dehydrogenase